MAKKNKDGKQQEKPANDTSVSASEVIDSITRPIAAALPSHLRSKVAWVRGVELVRSPKGYVIRQKPLCFEGENDKPETQLEAWDHKTLDELSQLWGGGPINIVCYDATNKWVANIGLDLPGEPRDNRNNDVVRSNTPTGSEHTLAGVSTVADRSGPMLVPHDLTLSERVVWIHTQQQLRQQQELHQQMVRELDKRLSLIVNLYESRVQESQFYAQQDTEKVRVFANMQMELLTNMFQQLMKANPTTGDSSQQKLIADQHKQIQAMQQQLFEVRLAELLAKKGGKTREEWMPQIKELVSEVPGLLEKVASTFERFQRIDSIDKVKEEFAEFLAQRKSTTTTTEIPTDVSPT